MKNCKICKNNISDKEYMNNRGYCKQCMDRIEAIETKMGQNNDKAKKIIIAVFIIFCIVVLAIPLIESINDGSFGGGSSSDRYQQKQVEDLKDELYEKGIDGKYYLK